MRLTLTNALIRKYMKQYDGNRVSLSDSKVPGLSVEVRQNTEHSICARRIKSAQHV